MTKKIVIVALTFGAIVLGTNTVHAQNTKATTTVNINLNDVISMDTGSTAIDNTVDFNYVTAADYNSDQTITKANSLKVTSTKSFNVKVKAGGPNFVNGLNSIPVDVLTIKASSVSGTMGGTKNTVVLSTGQKNLVEDAPLGSALTLNLDYIIPAAKSSSSDILGKPAGTYTQTVIFTTTGL